MAVSKYDVELDVARDANNSHAFVMGMVGANKRVLDVGCDTGYLGEALAAFGNTVSGFEVNPDAAAVARGHYAQVEVGDLEAVDLAAVFDGQQFDVIVFADVLEHLRDPLPVLRRVRSLVAPGGSVVISVPNVAHGDVRLALLQGRFRYTKVGLLDDTHTRFFTRESLAEFVRDAGFTLVELRRTRTPLFKTEVGVREDDFPADVVAALRGDPEATTYQFVVRAAPEDVVQVSSEQALLVDALATQLEEQRRLVRELRAREAALTKRVDELTAPASGRQSSSAHQGRAAALLRRLRDAKARRGR